MALGDLRANDSANNAFLNGVPTNSTTGVNRNFDYGAAAAQLQHATAAAMPQAPQQTAPSALPSATVQPSSPQQVQYPSPAVTPTPRGPATLGYNFSTGELFSGGRTFDASNGTALDTANSQGLLDLDNQTLPQGFSPVPATQAKAKLATMQQGRSYLNTAGEIAKGLGRGAAYGLPTAGAQALEYGANVVGAPDTAAYFHDKAAQIQGAEPPADLLARGDFAKTAINTAESAPLAAAIGAGFVINPAVGAGMTALAAGQQATQARNAVLNNGGTTDNADTAAWQNFVEEAAGDIGAGAIFRGMAQGTANVFSGLLNDGKITLKQAITAATNPAVAKNFLKNLAVGTVEGSAGQFVKSDAETRSMNAYGAPYQDPEQQGLQGAEQAALLTPFIGLSGLPEHLQAGRQRGMLGAAMSDPNNPVSMLTAARIIHSNIKDQVPPGSADGWLGSQTRTANKYLRKQAIEAYDKANPEEGVQPAVQPDATQAQPAAQAAAQAAQAHVDPELQDDTNAPDDAPIPLNKPDIAATRPLPPGLTKASPRFGENKIEFAADIDKAAYIANPQSSVRSKAHQQYYDWLTSLGLSPEGIASHAADVKEAVKNATPDKNGVLKIDPLYSADNTAIQPTTDASTLDAKAVQTPELPTDGDKSVTKTTAAAVADALHGNTILQDGTHADGIAKQANVVAALGGRMDNVSARVAPTLTPQKRSGLTDSENSPKWSTQLRDIADRMDSGEKFGKLLSPYKKLRDSMQSSNRKGERPTEEAAATTQQMHAIRDTLPFAKDLSTAKLKEHAQTLRDAADALDKVQVGRNITGGNFNEKGTDETLATLQDKLKKSIDKLVKVTKGNSKDDTKAYAAIESIIAKYKTEKERLNGVDTASINDVHGNFDPEGPAADIKKRNQFDRQLSMAWNAYKKGNLAEITERGLTTDKPLGTIRDTVIREEGIHNDDASQSPLNTRGAKGFTYDATKEGPTFTGVEGVLRYLNNSGTAMERTISKLLLTAYKGKFPDINFVNAEDAKGKLAKGTLGNYSLPSAAQPNGRINVFKATPETVLHEIYHGATAEWINRNPNHPFVIQLGAQLKHIEKDIFDQNWAFEAKGTKERLVADTIDAINSAKVPKDSTVNAARVTEFVSYAMTRSPFLEYMQKISLNKNQMEVLGLGHTAEESKIFARLKTVYSFFTKILHKVLGVANVDGLNKTLVPHRKFSEYLMDRIVGLTQEASNMPETTKSSLKGTFDMTNNPGTPASVQDILDQTRKNVEHGNILDNVMSFPFKLLLPKLYGKKATFIADTEAKVAEKSDDFMRAHPDVAYWYGKVGEYVGIQKNVKEAFDDIYQQSRESDSNLGNRLEDVLKNISSEHEHVIMDALQNPEKMNAVPAEYRDMVERTKALLLKLRDKAQASGGLDKLLHNATVAEMMQYAEDKRNIASAGFTTAPAKLNTAYKVKQEIEVDHVIFPQGEPGSTRYFAVPTDVRLGKQVPMMMISVDDRASVAAYGADKSVSYSFDKVIGGGKAQFIRNKTFKEIGEAKKQVPLAHLLANTVAVMSKAVASRELVHNLKTINEDANTKHKFIYDSKEALLASKGKPRIIDWGIDGGNLLPEDKQAARRIDVWVKVPGRFGDLKGSYVNGSVFGAMLDLSSGEQFIRSHTYSKLMQWWKGNKTKWSPSTHMTNTVSNVGMAYINDIPMTTVKLAAKIISKNWSGGAITPAEKQLLEMFNQSGAVLGNYSPNELHRKIAAALADDVNDKGDDPNSLWTTAKTMMRFEKIKATYNTISTGAGDLYQFEDNMFRFGAFIKELSVQQERHGALEDKHILAAGAFAKAAMINYNIHAPLINALRQTVLPFLAWPYRAVPMLTRIAYQKPWKIAGMGSVVYAINALGYAATGGNEDDERKRLPQSMKQHVWGIGPSSYVRMPWGDSNTPTFLGLGKDIPNGDLIQQNDHGFMGVDDWPSFATPTGPWVSILMAGAGYDSYQGRRLYGDTDTTTQKAMASLKYLDNQLSPNVPGMNARLNQQISDAYRGKKGLVGNDIDGMYTIMRDLGIGLSKLDRGELNAQQALQIKSLLGDYHKQVSASMHAESRYGEPDYDSIVEDNKRRGKNLLEQIQKLTGEY